ncbi:hypothetical protein [Candidatus Chloroploca sp. Khr17]|uniref:hypothetical protein n=1 Tax=Candidatus Chloroploca sp. Khr17 TaxID=2496869 RepID=UPI00101E0A39|nr:hypothetical protein [Candidatus Chloroploca sp. Khr17]
MKIRATMNHLATVAVQEIGFCVGIHWHTVTLTAPPPGALTARCRLVTVLFTGREPAHRYHAVLQRQHLDCHPAAHIRERTVQAADQTLRGFGVTAVLSPQQTAAEGLRQAPPIQHQAGTRRFFARLAQAARPQRPWWDDDAEADNPTDRWTYDAFVHRADAAYNDELEHELAQIEAAYNAKLSGAGGASRRAALASVEALVAYARRREVSPDEFARRNAARQAEQEAWLATQRQRETERAQALAADAAEVAMALRRSPRARQRRTA